MKRVLTILFLLGILLIPSIVVAQNTSLWLLNQGKLKPVVASWGISIGSTVTSTFTGPLQSSCFTVDGATCIPTTSITNYWNRSGSYVYLTTSTDKVGIETSTPPEKLFVGNGAGTSATWIGIDSPSNRSAGIRLYDTGSYKWALARVATTGDFGIYNYSLSSYALSIVSSTNYVGIGTTTPTHTLEVSGTAQFTGTTTMPYGSWFGDSVNDRIVLSETDFGVRGHYPMIKFNSQGQTYGNTAGAIQDMLSVVGINIAPTIGLANSGGTVVSTLSFNEGTGILDYANLTGSVSATFNADYLTSDNNITANGIVNVVSTTGGYQLGGAKFIWGGNNNTVLGLTAMANNISGDWNTAIGQGCLNGNTTGRLNTAVGNDVLTSNTDGDDNVGIGTQALYSNTTGTYNIGIGSAALYANETGNYNIAIGNNADVSSVGLTNAITIGRESRVAASNTMVLGGTGSYAINVGIGKTTASQQLDITKNFAMTSTEGTTPYGIIYKGSNSFIHNFSYGLNGLGITPQGENTFIGVDSGNFTMGATADAVTKSSYNTGVGYLTLNKLTTGESNVAVGDRAGANLTSGAWNTALGYLALNQNTTGFDNTALGEQAMRYNLTGSNNTMVGYYAMRANVAGNASDNTGVGRYALGTIETGSYNVAVGEYALQWGNDMTGNTALGSYTLTNTIGNYNVGVGYGVLETNTSGGNNVGIGYRSLYTLNGTNLNTAIGFQSLYNSTGENNVALGAYAGRYLNSSNAFIVNALNRETSARDLSDSLLYGTFNIVPSSQTLRINAVASIYGNLTTYGNITATGTVSSTGLQVNGNSTTTGNIVVSGTSTLATTSITGQVGLNGSYISNWASAGTNYWSDSGTYLTPVTTTNAINSQTKTAGFYLAGASFLRGTAGSENVVLGYNNLPTSASGYSNIAIGSNAMGYVTGGQYSNIAIGESALTGETVTIGLSNLAIGAQSMRYGIGNDNIALGPESLKANEGDSNIGIGGGTLYENTGDRNIAIGDFTLYHNLIGNHNIAFGKDSLKFSTSGSSNIGIGEEASYQINGNYNVAVGFQTMAQAITGAENIAIGAGALPNINGSSYNIGIGSQSMTNNVTGQYSIAIGYAADVYGNYSNAIAIGKNASAKASNTMVLGGTGVDAINVGIGTTTPTHTLEVSGTAQITDDLILDINSVIYQNSSRFLHTYGLGNTFMGSSSGNFTLSGANYNAGIGELALSSLTTGDYNMAIGFEALEHETYASNNTALGAQSLHDLVYGNANTGIGTFALYSTNNGGLRNIGIGLSAMYYNVAGSYNTAIGSHAGTSPGGIIITNANVTGDYNTMIGYYTGQSVASTTDVNNSTAIGAYAVYSGSNMMVLGATSSAYRVKVGIGTDSPGYPLDIIAYNTTGIRVTRYAESGSLGAPMNFRVANGYDYAPTRIMKDNQIFGQGTSGYTGEGWTVLGGNKAFIAYSAAEDWNTTTTVGTYQWFGTTHIGTGNVGAGHTHMRLENNGYMYLTDQDNTPVQDDHAYAQLHQYATGSTYHLFSNDVTGSTTASSGFNIGIDASGNAEIKQDMALPLYFYTSSTLRYTILANGNVGIGTSTPTSTLDVYSASSTNLLVNFYNEVQDIVKVFKNAIVRIGSATNYTQFADDGTISFTGTAGIEIPHMMQSDNTDQTIASTTNPQVITFDTDVHHQGITRTSSSRFTMNKAGSYMITFSGITTGVINKNIYVWLKVNGTDVEDSNTRYTYKSNGGTAVIAVSFIQHFAVNDYFEFWTVGDDTGNKWDYTASSTVPTMPTTPSIIMTTNYVSKD